MQLVSSRSALCVSNCRRMAAFCSAWLPWTRSKAGSEPWEKCTGLTSCGSLFLLRQVIMRGKLESSSSRSSSSMREWEREAQSLLLYVYGPLLNHHMKKRENSRNQIDDLLGWMERCRQFEFGYSILSLDIILTARNIQPNSPPSFKRIHGAH